jgi:hypothetical protein
LRILGYGVLVGFSNCGVVFPLVIARISPFCRLYGFIDWDGVLGVLGVFVDLGFWGFYGFCDLGFLGILLVFVIWGFC